jgi:phage FluMu gp28-like protein
LQRALEEGLVEKIDGKTDLTQRRKDEKTQRFLQEETEKRRKEWLDQQRGECIDEEQWLQEYCCVPADEGAAFISFEMITGCEEAGLRLMEFGELEELVEVKGERGERRVFYVGVDVGRKHDLCVIDVGEKVGDVVWDRARLEFQGRSFSEIESELFRLLKLPQVKRVCIDATGMGMQLAERAEDRFAWKVEPITFTAAVKEELAFGLRSDFQERKLRIVSDDKLRSDLRGIKKEVSLSGNIRFLGESKDGHCDRCWALALRQHAARYRSEVGAAVG